MRVLHLPGDRFFPDSLSFAPDGRTLGVVRAWNHDLLLIDTLNGEARVGPKPGDFMRSWYAFAAGGAEVVTCRSRLVTVSDAVTGAERRTIPMPIAVGWAVTPDCRTLLTVQTAPGQSALARYDLATGQPLPPVATPRLGAGYQATAFSADGRRLAIAQTRRVPVWAIGPQPATRAAAVLEIAGGGWVRTVALSADGRFAAAVVGTAAFVWDTQRRKADPLVLDGRGRHLEGIAFHPSRPLLATAGTDKTVVFWEPDGREVRRFAWEIGRLSNVAFSPDGLQAAAAGEGKVVVWDVD